MRRVQNQLLLVLVLPLKAVHGVVRVVRVVGAVRVVGVVGVVRVVGVVGVGSPDRRAGRIVFATSTNAL
jgi:hypothetical protein